ncbi:MAG: TatD family hydrolase, partial [Gammaproteobacteria bacterium]|nr:TatD family hydrolase [Gammaproteobacteria bacterium]
PWLAPVPWRGKTNQPAYVHDVASYLAELRQEGFDELSKSTSDNFFRLFKFAQRDAGAQ